MAVDDHAPALASEKVSEVDAPKSGRKSTRSTFWRFMLLVCISAGLTHAVFGVLFYNLDATFLAWANVGSVSIFAGAYLAILCQRNWLATVLVMSALMGHAALAVWCIGWDSGFHYYLMLVAPVVVLSNLRKVQSKLLMVASVCMFYMILDALIRVKTPIYALPEGVIASLRYFNILVSFVLLTYLALMYLHMVKTAERKLLIAASTDPLTSLYNRRRLTEIIDYELKRCKREPRTLCFLLGDIDHFKSINDRYGHEGGDLVLTEVSKVLRAAVREQDSVGRWGGEEFLVVLPNTELEGAQVVAERVFGALTNLQLDVGGQRVPVTMTVGLSTCKEDESMEVAIARADAALYQGKEAGRNRLVLEQRES